MLMLGTDRSEDRGARDSRKGCEETNNRIDPPKNFFD
jgi:hypothetical protein